MPRNRSLSLTVQYATRDGILPERADIGRWARSAFIDRPPGGGEVTVRFVDVEEARDLNRTYRNRDYATNILSFLYDRTPVLTGDLVVCADVVLREAGEQNKLPLAHYAHLIVHGMLHLQGFEHETGAEDAVKMETAERNILAGLGFPDPYTEI